MRELFNTIIRNVLVLPFVRLVYKIKLFVYKKALNLQLLLIFQIRNKIRYRSPEARLEGFDEKFDTVVHLVSLRLVSPEQFDFEAYPFLFEGILDKLKPTFQIRKSEYIQQKDRIEGLISEISDDTEIKEAIEKCILVEHYLANQKGNQKAAVHYLSRVKRLNPKAEPLTQNELSPLERATRKRIKELRELISDRTAFKISLSFRDAGSMVLAVSSFFLVTGYLYNYFLLGAFGIEVSKYYRLTDYLASSIEGISYSASGAIFGVIGVFLGMHSLSRKSVLQIETERSRREYWPYFIFGTALVGAIIGYFNNLETFYGAVSAIILFSGFYFSPRIAMKYFKEPMAALFILVFVAAFSAHMFYSIGSSFYKFKHYDFSKLGTYEIGFKKDIQLGSKELTLIAGNSDYFFFIDSQRNPIIIRKDEVLFIKRITAGEKKTSNSI